MTILRDIDTIILHTPKTGGSSVRWPAVKKHGLRYSCQHCNYNMLPKKYNNFRKMTFVRNPISWYASRYYFDKMRFKSGKHRDSVVTSLSREYRDDFETTLNRMINIGEAFEDKGILKLYQSYLKKDVMNNYTCWTVSYHDDISEIGHDTFGDKTYYQWQIEMIGIENADATYRLEDEYEKGMILEFGRDIELTHRNKSGRKEDENVYTPQMKKIIVNAESNFIEKYGYERMI